MLFPLLASTLATVAAHPVYCRTVTPLNEKYSVCYIAVRSDGWEILGADSHNGYILFVDTQGNLAVPNPGRYMPVLGEDRQPFAVGKDLRYMGYMGAASLKDGRTVEFYGHDALVHSNIVYEIGPDKKLSPLPDGVYELKNGQKFRLSHSYVGAYFNAKKKMLMDPESDNQPYRMVE